MADDGHADILARMESLRGYRRIPAGRGNRARHLSDGEVAQAILGLTPLKPGWAGHVALILGDLRPVGGPEASFYGAETLNAAIETIISDKEARETLQDIVLSSAMSEGNVNGLAEIVYRREGVTISVWFYSKMAITLATPGSETCFDPYQHKAKMARQLSLGRGFFQDLARNLEYARLLPHEPMGDGSEYDAGEAEEARRSALGCTPRSRFINVGVDTQVTWPNKEKLISFDRYKLVLMPKTREYTQSIHIDLTANKLDDREAMTVINRFLSVLSWIDGQFATAEWGWSGNPVPVPVNRRNLAFATAYEWPFYRSIPTDENARRALALYREGLNAEAMSLTCYAVLSYFKIIELGFKDDDQKVKRWIARTLPVVTADATDSYRVAEFINDCGDTPPGDYLWTACRVAVAHASRKSPTDADDSGELRRLGAAAEVLQELAKRLIVEKFAISDSPFGDDMPDSEPVES